MSRYDLRWMSRHPLKWLRILWLPWTVAGIMVVKAVAAASPVFDVTAGYELWPALLGLTAGMAALSAVAPLDERVQAFSTTVLFVVALLRALTYVHTYATAWESLGETGRVIVVALALHWALLAVIFTLWHSILEHSGRELAAESGRDDNGHARLDARDVA